MDRTPGARSPVYPLGVWAYAGDMTTSAVKLTVAVAALAATAALASCGAADTRSGQSGAAAPSAAAGPATAEAAEHNSEDVMFAHMMIPHHEQALELSALVPDRSTDPALIKLAAAIAAEQKPEIEAMRQLLAGWGNGPMGGMHGDTGVMDQAGMMGMVDAATMDRLRALKGAEFDTLWLQSMIGHHEGAIAMAKPEVEKGRNPELIAMARGIITGQQAEIDRMNQMLAGLGG